MSRMPFLNSTMPLPSERPTSGSRLPKSKTAITPTIIISIGPRPNIATPHHKAGGIGLPVATHARGLNSQISNPKSQISNKPKIAMSKSLRCFRGFFFLLLFDPLYALLELHDALAERTHDAGKPAAKQQQHHNSDDQQFGQTNAPEGKHDGNSRVGG